MRPLRSMESTNQRAKFLPFFQASNFTDIDIQALRDIGITTLAIDLDSTITFHKQSYISPEVLDFLQASKMKIVIATNRLDGINKEIITALKPFYAQHATPQYRKPQALYFQKLLEGAEEPAENVCMIGDRLMTDIWGANKAGIRTLWVQNIGPDPWYTKVFLIRPIEHLMVQLLS